MAGHCSPERLTHLAALACGSEHKFPAKCGLRW